MLTKKICKAVVSALSICALIAVSILPCYAGYISSYTAKEFWFGSSKVYGYMHTTGSYPLSEYIPDSCISSYTADLKNYVDWQSVTQGYISSQYAFIEDTLTAYDTSNAYGLQVKLLDEWTFIKGRTYEFVVLLENMQFYNGTTKISGDPRLYSITFSGTSADVTATTEVKKLYGTEGGYIAAFAYRCTLTPTEDIYVTTINFEFRNYSHASYTATSAAIGFGFSDCVSYTGELEDVVVNPTLDNIEKQVDEINGKLDDVKDDIMGDPSQDTAPGLDGLESQGQEANDALDDLLHGIDVPDGKEHWSQAMQLFKDINLLAAFQWWGLCFDYVSAHALLSYLSLFSCLIMLLLSVFGCYRSAVFRLNSESRNAEKEVTATYHSEVHRAGAKNYRVQDRVRTTTYRRGRAVRTRENVNISFRKEE